MKKNPKAQEIRPLPSEWITSNYKPSTQHRKPMAEWLGLALDIGVSFLQKMKVNRERRRGGRDL